MTDTQMNGHTEENDSMVMEKKSESCCVTDLPIDKVTVYKNKAEVVRFLKLEVLPTQQIEICFEQLPSSVDPNSIRVDVANKTASILDVTYNCKPLSQANNQTERSLQINKTLHDLELELESLEAKKARYLKQKSVLDCFTDTLVSRLNDDNAQEEEEEEHLEILPSPPQKLSKAEKKQSKLDLLVTPPPKPAPIKQETKMNPYDPTHLETVSNFFQLYDERGEKFDKEIQASIQQISETEAKIEALKEEKKEIDLRIDELLYRELLVIIEGITQSEEAIISLTYVVKDCTWTSNYDIRVSNQTGVMQICYYATVRQMSHEDWYQPRLFAVSTMEPGVGGTVPELAVQRVRFKNQLTHFADQVCEAGSPTTSPSAQSNGSVSSPSSPQMQPVVMASPSIKRGGSSTSFRSSSIRKSKSISMDFMHWNSIPETVKTTDMPMNNFFDDGIYHGSATVSKTNSTTAMAAGTYSNMSTLTRHNKPAIKSANKSDTSANKSATTNSSGDSVHYEIPRAPLMVMCDNKECKIMIGQYSFEPSYNYVTVPRLSPYAYQRALTTNKSGVTFLAGAANIFIDGCFIGKTFIKDIHPSEEFICNLGVDKGISIHYDPLIKFKDNHSKNLCVTYRQVIQMTNRNARPAKVTLTERIPVVTDGEKIKIQLLEPSLKSDKGKSIRKNDLGQIDWDHEIAPGATKEAVIKFAIEHPIEREVVISNLA